MKLKCMPLTEPRGDIYHLTIQNYIFSKNDVLSLAGGKGTGAIDITLAHARFVWAGAIVVAWACWGIGRFPAGWVEETLETVILGWG